MILSIRGPMVEGKSISLPFALEEEASGKTPPVPGFGVDGRIEISESESSMLVKSIVAVDLGRV
jgi:hypothetical protein